MFGIRKTSTRRKLARQPKLFWAPLFSHPPSWIGEAMGVLDITGTSLLETAFLDIPALLLELLNAWLVFGQKL